FLPLDRTKLRKIAVIGPHADLFTAGGYSGKADKPVKPLQGIRNRAAKETEIVYAKGCEIEPTAKTPDKPESIAEAAAIAKDADVAIVYVGTTNAIEREGNDRKT